MASALDNKVPPPVVLLISLMLIRLVAAVDSVLSLPFNMRLYGAALLVLLGLGIAIAAVMSFRDVETTINPLKPESASSLVSTGVFKFTRNPMYLGMVCIALAATVYFSSILSLLVVAVLVAYLTCFQILPEERAMQALFPEEFEAYKSNARRWC